MKTFWILMCLLGSVLGGAVRQGTDCERLGCKAVEYRYDAGTGCPGGAFWTNVVMTHGSCECTEAGACKPKATSAQQCSIIGTVGVVNLGPAPACVCSHGAAVGPGEVATGRVAIVGGPGCLGQVAILGMACHGVACGPAGPDGRPTCPLPPAVPAGRAWLALACTSCAFSCNSGND